MYKRMEENHAQNQVKTLSNTGVLMSSICSRFFLPYSLLFVFLFFTSIQLWAVRNLHRPERTFELIFLHIFQKNHVHV